MSDALNLTLGFSIFNEPTGALNRIFRSLDRTSSAAYRASRNFNALDDSVSRGTNSFDRYSTSMAKSTAIAASLGTAFYYLTGTIKEAVKYGVEYEKQLINIRNASGFTKDIKSISTEIKGLTDSMYSLVDVSKAYYQIYSAGIVGSGNLGKSATAVAVDMAKMFSIISQGEVTLEQATEIVPALIKKTGLSLTREYGNGITDVSRFLDKIAAVINLTKMKVKDIPSMLDSTRTALSQVRGEFENMLSITGVLMTAGMTKKEAGQSYNILVRTLAKDAALIKSQKEVFKPLLDLKKQVAIYRGLTPFTSEGQDMGTVFGGAKGFEKYVNDLITGSKTVAEAQKDIFGEMFKGASADFKNKFQSFLFKIEEQNTRVIGGFTARKKLFAISKLFPSLNDLQDALDDAFSGRISLTEYYAKISKGLDKEIEVIGKDGKKRMIKAFSQYDQRALLRLMFGEDSAAQAFLQLRNYVTEVERDVYKVDAAGNRLGKNPIFKKGQLVMGFEALDYLEKAAKDSKGFADKFKTAYENSTAGLLQMKKALSETFKTLLGESILPILNVFLKSLNTFLASINEIVKNKPAVAQFLGGFTLVTAASIGLAGVVSTLKLMRGVLGTVFTELSEGALKSAKATDALNKQLQVTNSLRAGDTIIDMGNVSKSSKVSAMADITSLTNIDKSIKRREEFGAILAKRRYDINVQKLNSDFKKNLADFKKHQEGLNLSGKSSELKKLYKDRYNLKGLKAEIGASKFKELYAQESKAINKKIRNLQRSINTAEKNKLNFLDSQRKKLITQKVLLKRQLKMDLANNSAQIGLLTHKKSLVGSNLLSTLDKSNSKHRIKLFDGISKFFKSPMMMFIGKMASLTIVVTSIMWMFKKNIGLFGEIKKFVQGTDEKIGFLSRIKGFFELSNNSGKFKNYETQKNLLTTNEKAAIEYLQKAPEYKLDEKGQRLKDASGKDILNTKVFQLGEGGKRAVEIRPTGMYNILSKTLPKIYRDLILENEAIESDYMKSAEANLLKNISGGVESTEAREFYEKVLSRYSSVLVQYNAEQITANKDAIKARYGLGDDSDKTIELLKTIASKPELENVRKGYEETVKQINDITKDAKKRAFFNENAGNTLAKMFTKFQEFFAQFETHLANIALGVGISGLLLKSGGFMTRMVNMLGIIGGVTIATNVGKKLSEGDVAGAMSQIGVSAGTGVVAGFGVKLLKSMGILGKDFPIIGTMAAAGGLASAVWETYLKSKEDNKAIGDLLEARIKSERGSGNTELGKSWYATGRLTITGDFNKQVSELFDTIVPKKVGDTGGYEMYSVNSDAYDKLFNKYVEGYVDLTGLENINLRNNLSGLGLTSEDGKYSFKDIVELYKKYAAQEYNSSTLTSTQKEKLGFKDSFLDKANFSQIMREIRGKIKNQFKSNLKSSLIDPAGTENSGELSTEIDRTLAQVGKTLVQPINVDSLADSSNNLADEIKKNGLFLKENTKALTKNNDFIYFEIGASQYGKRISPKEARDDIWNGLKMWGDEKKRIAAWEWNTTKEKNDKKWNTPFYEFDNFNVTNDLKLQEILSSIRSLTMLSDLDLSLEDIKERKRNKLIIETRKLDENRRKQEEILGYDNLINWYEKVSQNSFNKDFEKLKKEYIDKDLSLDEGYNKYKKILQRQERRELNIEELKKLRDNVSNDMSLNQALDGKIEFTLNLDINGKESGQKLIETLSIKQTNQARVFESKLGAKTVKIG
jgi:TP901 family phage tail tape measure protein